MNTRKYKNKFTRNHTTDFGKSTDVGQFINQEDFRPDIKMPDVKLYPYQVGFGEFMGRKAIPVKLSF